jgi:hypothetical protein
MALWRRWWLGRQTVIGCAAWWIGRAMRSRTEE